MLLAQTTQPFEVIVVDQTSSYGKEEYNLLKRAVSNIGAKWVKQDEHSASKARNRGLLEAKSDIVLFLDDDVVFKSNLLEEHIEPYRSSSVTGVAGQVLQGGSERFDRSWLSKNRKFGWLFFPFNYAHAACVKGGMAGNLSVLRKNAIAVGGMDENFCAGGFREETDFCLRYSARFGWFAFNPRASIATISDPSGGIRTLPRSVAEKNHLWCEFYFIRRNCSFPEAIVHWAYAFYRRWIQRPSACDYLLRTLPLILITALKVYTRPLPSPAYGVQNA